MARRAARWTRRPPGLRRVLVVCAVVLGVLAGLLLAWPILMVSRVNDALDRVDSLLGDARAPRSRDIRGPLNFLLIGSNWRDNNPSNGERADSIMIVHVPRDMNRAFLVSVPRDLYFTIKPYAPTHFEGSTEKIDAALNHGGMPLMAQTVADLTDLKFNGAVEARFAGFQKAVTALGGVDLCVDQKTTSVHVGHDQNGNYAAPYQNLDADPEPVPGITPHVYYPGCQHLEPWAALDYVRQRILLPGGDYDRQRHQQQLIMAVLKQTTSAGTLTDPIKLDRVLRTIAQSVTIDTNGHSLIDLVLALRGIKAESLVGIRTPSRPEMMGGTSYVLGEPGMPELWKAIRNDTLDTYAAAHPELLNSLG